MKQKTLSLCFPTYNRGWCMKEQIERLMTCPKEVLDKIEIIISDNCSTDDTQQIIEKAIASGFICRYIRNETNLGADGNFVSCLRKATGRYVWLLGDDDIIIIDSLKKIVEILETSNECGLLHISQKYNENVNESKVLDKYEIIKHISYHITFISANIVNTKYVSNVDLEKYIGTWFPYIPLYYTAITKESSNFIFKYKTFDGAKDTVRNGGYNFFEVFVQTYLSIIKDFIDNQNLYLWLKKDIWPFIWGYTKQLLIKRDVGNFQIKNGWKILIYHYGYNWYFWKELVMYPIITIRKIISKKNIHK